MPASITCTTARRTATNATLEKRMLRSWMPATVVTKPSGSSAFTPVKWLDATLYIRCSSSTTLAMRLSVTGP